MLSILIINYLVANYLTHTYVSAMDPFTINTDGCRIPAYPLMSENIRELVEPPSFSKASNCSKHIPLVEANSTHVWVVKSLYDIFGIFVESELSCCYRNFSAEGNLENIAYGVCDEFSTTKKAEHEFVRVECYYSGDKIYEDLFRFNVHKMNTPKRDERFFSVLMFGIDGMSRKNFLRTMSKTSNFMKHRSSISLYGYNKLGDNSYPNLFPMLTGRSFNEARKVCFRNNILDSGACTFMWDIFKTAGYHTALGADSAIGLLGGYESLLHYKPTDFYLQSFMYETRHVFRDRTYDYHICLNNRYMFKELLKFAQDVATTVHRGKLFGIFWEESVSHSHLNFPYIMDADYLGMLSEFERKKTLEDTIVIMFSDHGARFGEIMSTEQGRQESRLPLFEVMFPVRFRRRYKTAFKNFELNSHRLTTAQDIYQTLLDLTNPSSIEDHQLRERAKNMSEETKGMSLFLPVPLNRSCKSLGIPEHWCACLKGERVPIGEKGKIFTAKYLLKHINQILSEYPQCRKLKIEKILDVTAMKEKNQRQKTFRVLVQTTPGRGVFEGTLVQDRALWTLSGAASRLDSYGNQSHCVKDPIAKNYCYCKKL